jgi:hypothetical protein
MNLSSQPSGGQLSEWNHTIPEKYISQQAVVIDLFSEMTPKGSRTGNTIFLCRL